LVRLADLPAHLAERYAAAECPKFETTPIATGPSLGERRVAIVSSAGLNRRHQPRFIGPDKDFRAIPSATNPSDILMSHVSLGFDRTAFQQDLNTVFPIDRLRDIAKQGYIGSVAETHYSFMGGGSPEGMEPFARKVAHHLQADKVTAVVLIPV